MPDSQGETGLKEQGAKAPRPKTGAYVLEEQIGYLLRRAHQRASSIFAGHFADLNLTPTQFAALAKISEESGVSQNLLGRLTAMDPATMKGVVDRLLERGLITRHSDPTDRRRAVLDLSKEGAALIRKARGLGFRTTADTLAPLDPAEQATLLKLLGRLC